MKKKNSRVEGKTVKVKRQDIRIPLDFYNRLKQIAVEKFNAHVHHRSGEPVITPTLLKLAELGIEYLESGLADKNNEFATTEVFKRLENIEQRYSDNNNDIVSEELTERIKSLEKQLADINTDKLDKELANRIEVIEQKLSNNNNDNIRDRIVKRLDTIEQNLNDNNDDKLSQKLTERLAIVEKQLADINTDNNPLISNEKADTSQTITIKANEEEKPLSPELDDKNNDINNDNIENFYSGVKEAFSTSNDPDDNDKLEQENLESPEPIAIAPEQTGLTDLQLADEFGVNPSMVKRWRTGSSKPRGNNAKRLKQWEVKGDRWYKKIN